MLLSDLRAEVATLEQPVGSHDRQRDVMPYACFGFGSEKVAGRCLEEGQRFGSFQGRRVRHVDDHRGAFEDFGHTFSRDGVAARVGRRGHRFVAVRAKLANEFGSDETGPTNNDDFHDGLLDRARLAYPSNGAFINTSTGDSALYAGTKRSPKSRAKLSYVVSGLVLTMRQTESVKPFFMSRRGYAARMLFISWAGMRSYWNPPQSRPMPAVESATSASLYSAMEGVEFKATVSQISCTWRSSKPSSRANARAASAPSISKRLGPVKLSVSPRSWSNVPTAMTSGSWGIPCSCPSRTAKSQDRTA